MTPWQVEKLLNGQYKGFFVGHYKLTNRLPASDVRCTAIDLLTNEPVLLLLTPNPEVPGGSDFEVLDGHYGG
ncbi:MAG TPA: hypothetical protein VL175_22150 [Pirellulales bacterium]|jgi:hypothetical protein|nr:hypothetical protein [Pirellulales bacterium]